MNSPKLVDPTFLSPGECDHVFQRVLHYRDKWVSIRDTSIPPVPGVDVSQHCASFFGPSVYCLNKDIPRYQQLKSVYNEILVQEFGDIYRRLLTAISHALEADIEYCDGVSRPGFHIFGPGIADRPVDYNYFHNHQDLYPEEINGVIPRGKICSFLIPVRMPAAGACLFYNSNSVYQYTAGSLVQWPGEIWHQIGDFVLDGENDYRVTWQIHVTLNHNRGTIYW